MSLILQVLLILTLVTAAAKVAGAVSVRCGQPAVFGEVLAGLLLGPRLLDVLGWGEAFFIGAVLTATSVSISAQTLMELRSLRSREGSAILGAAVIDDVMGIVVLSLVVGFVAGGPVGSAGGGGEPAGPAGGTAAVLAWIVLRVALFFVPAWVLGRPPLGRLPA